MDGCGSRENRRVSTEFCHIADQYQSVGQVTDSLINAGLESSNLILGIDFTKSNEWTGKHSFNGHSLHAVGAAANPYEMAISIIGRTLSKFDDDNLIPCFGFGDASTHDQSVFSFYEDHRPCHGFEDALRRYKQLVPSIRLAGPTSFAPVIQAAIDIVEESGGRYHVLVIVADGQEMDIVSKCVAAAELRVTRSVDTGYGRLSPQEKATFDAIVTASDYPLSIILVGVGDGPWDMMREFDDNIPARAFDNFQFVNFSDIMSRSLAWEHKEAMFALAALMEIPEQYRATQKLGLLGRRLWRPQLTAPFPPPQTMIQADTQMPPIYAEPGSYSHSGVPGGYTTSDSYAPQYSSSSDFMNVPPHLQPRSAYPYPPQQST